MLCTHKTTFSASLDYFVKSSPPYLHQFSTISGGNCINWWSKKQTSAEFSSFGSEFVAMKQCCEYIRGLRYKLRIMGIPVEGPTYIYGDNHSVLANTTIPDSTLKKKSQSIAYHYVHEGVARDEWRTSYVNTHDKEADLRPVW